MKVSLVMVTKVGGVMGGGGGSRSGSSVGVKMVGKGLNYISELHM